jgi:hypothetical protein
MTILIIFCNSKNIITFRLLLLTIMFIVHNCIFKISIFLHYEPIQISQRSTVGTSIFHYATLMLGIQCTYSLTSHKY